MKQAGTQPLAFKLRQSIYFNRPLDMARDHVAPGPYSAVMALEDGSEERMNFGFTNLKAKPDPDDPKVLHCVQEGLDTKEFPDAARITGHMLRHVMRSEMWHMRVLCEGGLDHLWAVKITNVALELPDGSAVPLPDVNAYTLSLEGSSPENVQKAVKWLETNGLLPDILQPDPGNPRPVYKSVPGSDPSVLHEKAPELYGFLGGDHAGGMLSISIQGPDPKSEHCWMNKAAMEDEP